VSTDLIYIPCYFDFVSIRNLLLKKKASFVSVTEYARQSEINRGRSRFIQGFKNIMLYTGRTHFFKRYKIKGVKHVLFFGLPKYPEFYSNIVQFIENSQIQLSTCLALFTKYDAHALERIVGTLYCDRMITNTHKTKFMFSL